MSRSANFSIVEQTEKHVLIRDKGPWDQYPTVTNAAEEVVTTLLPLLEKRRLFYFDSEGELGELVSRNGVFVGFAPCTGIPNAGRKAEDNRI